MKNESKRTEDKGSGNITKEDYRKRKYSPGKFNEFIANDSEDDRDYMEHGDENV